MSHELRTPLNSLLILAEHLSRNPGGNLNPKQIEYARIMRSSGEDLLVLINDILDLTKIESGIVTLGFSDVRFSELRDSMERFRHVAESKRLDYSIQLASDLPSFIRTDEKRLEQILKNLLSNAFKFTERGSVSLKIFPVESGWTAENEALNKASKVLAFAVIDTGIGIPPDKQQIIFEAFQQAEGGNTRRYAGTGLGLSNQPPNWRGCWVAEIRVVEHARRRKHIHLILPQEPGTPPPTRKNGDARNSRRNQPQHRRNFPQPQARREESFDELHGPHVSLAGRKVLIVDDDVRNIFALASVLEHEDMEVLSAESAKDGIELLQKTPDIYLVMMDIMMPEMDGLEAIREIRKLSGFESLPIIALTAKAMKGDREKCLEAGASDYIAKPVDTSQLLSLLRHWAAERS